MIYLTLGSIRLAASSRIAELPAWQNLVCVTLCGYCLCPVFRMTCELQMYACCQKHAGACCGTDLIMLNALPMCVHDAS